MAEFHNITVTNDGMKLIALASAMQKPIVFDRMDIGDSRPTDASKVASLTAVVNKRIEATISDIRVVTNADVSEARYRILGKYSNSSVTTGFKLSEVGVIAHVESNYYQDSGWNGYAGENLLFGYFYADEGKEDWLPSKDMLMDDLQMGAYFTVSNATSIAVYINEEDNVSRFDFNVHLSDKNAHSDVIGCTSTSDGVRGFVPKPEKGDGEKFLSAEGKWKKAKMTPLELVNILYPKGIILPFADGTNPNQLWAGTTWKRTLQGRVPIGAGDYWENGKKFSYSVGDTGGEAEHKLTESELAKISPKIAAATLAVSRLAQIHGRVTNYSSTNEYKDVPRDGWSGTVISGEETGGGNKDHGMEVRNVLETLYPSVAIAPIGGDEKHENRPPFEAVCYWVRTQ